MFLSINIYFLGKRCIRVLALAVLGWDGGWFSCPSLCCSVLSGYFVANVHCFDY